MAQRISEAYGYTNDPIVSGETLRVDRRSGDAEVILKRASGKEIRYDSIIELWTPAKHHRLATLLAGAKFKLPSVAVAAQIAADISELCGNQQIDPLEEARDWVGEFIAAAVKELDCDGLDDRAVIAKLQQAEDDRSAPDRIDRRPVLIERGGELWLPAGDLKASTGTSLPWWRFTNRMLDIGWRKETIETRPTTRAGRAEGGSHKRRRFYVAEA